VRRAAVVEQRPAAPIALEAHDARAVLDIEALGELARQRIHRRHADPQRAARIALRPGGLPAGGRARGGRALEELAKARVGCGEVLRAVVETRDREAARRKPPARRALRLEHARVNAGFAKPPRAGEPCEPCADHGDGVGIRASLLA
jgi:hypothetical protein